MDTFDRVAIALLLLVSIGCLVVAVVCGVSLTPWAYGMFAPAITGAWCAWVLWTAYGTSE